MASREETEKKEELNTTYSDKVTELMCSYVGIIDNNLFKISVATSSSNEDLERIIDRFVEMEFGKCVFYRAALSGSTGFVVYASRLNEQQIIRILSLKAFW